MKTNTNPATMSKADQLRAALKAAGFTRKQVSVRTGGGSTETSLDVTVRDTTIALSAVEELAGKYENIRRCEATGEILGGGNTFLDVSYDDDAIRTAARAEVLDQLMAIDSTGIAGTITARGQSILIAKIADQRCPWNGEVVALDHQTDPAMRVRCYWDATKATDAEMHVGIAVRLLTLAIELAARAAVAAVEAPAHDVEQAIPVLSPSNCQPLPPFPAKATHLRIVRDEAPVATLAAEQDWSAGI